KEQLWLQPGEISGISSPEMAPCQPQEFLFVPVGGKAKISCVSNGTLDKLFRISWYRRTWRVGENPELILDWGEVTKGHKYNCTHTERSSSLEINNVKEEDSGTYYCAHFIYMSLIFSNGTTLIAGVFLKRPNHSCSLVPLYLYMGTEPLSDC
uniref:Ig-like domain-containing protein n=1 Tax=Xenopus tropicalis TaxID=8364 RepID=A0A803K0R7_XENTR